MTAKRAQPLMFFNNSEAATLESVIERILPPDEGFPGGVDAGILYYIDRTLTGYGSKLQRLYTLGLRDLDAFCSLRFGRECRELSPEQRDETISEFLGPPLPAPLTQASAPKSVEMERLQRLILVIREHCLEGLFCDPVYGGNREGIGWRLIGYPGAQWGYTEEQMSPGFDTRSIPIRTLADIREIAARPHDDSIYYPSRGS
jgi:gluconate 2-dehydrogenase gamma chain